MVIALLPLWGALMGSAGALKAPAWVIALGWIACARLEQRVLRLSDAYLASGVATAAVWWALSPLWFADALVGQAASRAAMIALAWIARPAASGAVFEMESWQAVVAIGFALVAALVLLPVRVAITILAAAFLIVRLVRDVAYRHKGGVDATALAIGKGVAEAAFAVLLSTLRGA